MIYTAHVVTASHAKAVKYISVPSAEQKSLLNQRFMMIETINYLKVSQTLSISSRNLVEVLKYE